MLLHKQFQDFQIDVAFSTNWLRSIASFLIDDLELAAQMDALGLPLSFSTNKVCLLL